jgi:hypothetical protein
MCLMDGFFPAIVGTHGFSFRYTSIQPVGAYP